MVQNLKEQLSVRAKNKGRGTPPPEAAGSNGTATPPLEDSAEPAFYPANMGALIKFGGPTVATLQAEIEQLNATQTQIKPSTTSERIGSLFTPGALIRTTQRNTKMVAKQVCLFVCVVSFVAHSARASAIYSIGRPMVLLLYPVSI